MFSIFFQDIWVCRACRVHQGFKSYYDVVREDVRKHSVFLANKYGSPFMITEVSLGGAAAAIASYDLLNYLKSQNLKPSLSTYTFGQPRIGNKALVDEINSQIQISLVILKYDPFLHISPRSSLYYNPGVQIFYPSFSSNTQICVGDYQDCSFMSTKDLPQQFCDHLSYPKIAFTSSNNLVAFAGYKYDFSISNQILEAAKDAQFVANLQNQAALCKQAGLQAENGEQLETESVKQLSQRLRRLELLVESLKGLEEPKADETL